MSLGFVRHCGKHDNHSTQAGCLQGSIGKAGRLHITRTPPSPPEEGHFLTCPTSTHPNNQAALWDSCLTISIDPHPCKCSRVNNKCCVCLKLQQQQMPVIHSWTLRAAGTMLHTKRGLAPCEGTGPLSRCHDPSTGEVQYARLNQAVNCCTLAAP